MPANTAETAPQGPDMRVHRPPSRRKKLLFAVLCVGVFWAVSCYGLEVYYWAALPARPGNGFHDGEVYTWGHRVRFNRAGFREREFAMPKPPGVYRIVVLGDSLTWGAGLGEEERYSSQLEARLLAVLPGRSIEVLNFGFQGASTTLLRDWWRTISPDVEADLLIVGFCINDTQPLGQDYSPERERFKWWLDSIEDLKTIGLRNVADRAKSVAERMLIALGLMPAWPDALNRTYQKDSPEWRAFEQALHDIREITASRGLPPPILAVLNQGVSSTEPTDYSRPTGLLLVYLRWYDQAREAARAVGFNVVSFEDMLADRLSNQVLAVNYYDGHPNAACNAIYAERLAEVVVPIIRRAAATTTPNP